MSKNDIDLIRLVLDEDDIFESSEPISVGVADRAVFVIEHEFDGVGTPVISSSYLSRGVKSTRTEQRIDFTKAETLAMQQAFDSLNRHK